MSEPDDVLVCLLLQWLYHDAPENDDEPPLSWGEPHDADSAACAMWSLHADRAARMASLEAAIAHEERRLELEQARDALVDAATEVACVWGTDLGSVTDLAHPALEVDELVDALNALYAANDRWQVAQCIATGMDPDEAREGSLAAYGNTKEGR